MKNLVAGPLLALTIGFTALAAAGQTATPTVAGFVNDPKGDGFSGPGMVIQDITRLRAYSGYSDPASSEESLQISLRFAAPIALSGSGAAEDLTGYIEIDLDRNPATGRQNTFFNAACPQPITLGSELQINLNSDATDGNVDVETADGVFLGTAPITLVEGLSTLTIDLPFSFLDGNNPVNLAAAVGTSFGVTDCAADSVVLTSVDRRTFTGRDEYENDDTPLRANYTGSAFQDPPFINMSELQFRSFDSPADEEWFFSTSVGLSISFILSPEIEDDPGFHPIVEFYDGQILTDPTAQPQRSVGDCDRTGTLRFVWGLAFMRIRNCPDPITPFVGTYRLSTDGFSQIDPPGSLVKGTVTEQGSGAPVAFLYVISNLNQATFTAPDTGFYQMAADGTMTIGIVDDVFVAAPQTITVPPNSTVVLDFVVTRFEEVFNDGFE